MSEVATAAKTLSATARKALYAPLADGIAAVAKTYVLAQSEIFALSLEFGRLIGDASVLLIAQGASGEEVQNEVQGTLKANGLAHLEWTTIQGWIRAYRVRETLPADIRESFGGIEQLKAMGGISDTPTRVKVAKALARKGAVTVKAAREARDTNKPQSKAKTVKTADRVADVVKAGKGILKTAGYTVGEMTPVESAMFGVALATKCPKRTPNIMRKAVEELLYTGPIGDDSDA